MRIVIRTRLSADAVRRAVASLPAAARDVGVRTAAGVALLSLVKSAFLVKARGGTDEAGLSWKPLAPSTLARRGEGAQIGRDKGALFAALSVAPGGSVVCDVPYAGHFHRVRPLWPDPADWPARWRQVVGAAQRAALVGTLRRSLGGG